VGVFLILEASQPSGTTYRLPAIALALRLRNTERAMPKRSNLKGPGRCIFCLLCTKVYLSRRNIALEPTLEQSRVKRFAPLKNGPG
jgi:hypothetical protein